MLHDLLLSLSLGHPSPLLLAASQSPSPSQTKILTPSGSKILSPPELALLRSLASLSTLHANLLASTAQIVQSHPSIICRSVASAIDSVFLSQFQREVLSLEGKILTRDAELVGGYDIVPLTAVVQGVEGWRRRLEWLWGVARYVNKGGEGRSGAGLLELLSAELRTGYPDVEAVSGGLLEVGERTWLRLVGGWVLYGKLIDGEKDFFIVRRRGKRPAEADEVEGEEEEEEEWGIERELMPGFVGMEAAESMLFIGRSLNHIRRKKMMAGEDHLSSQLGRLGGLRSPLDRASVGLVVKEIRSYLSRTVLRKLLPVDKVVEALGLLRDYFLLRRGEFAVALIQQADEKIRSRWKRQENLSAGGFEKRDGLGSVTVREGEVAAALVRTWAAMGSMRRGEYAEDDEEDDQGVELARDLLRLMIAKTRSTSNPITTSPAATEGGLASIAPTPFRNLLFSVPVVLTMQIPSPLDLFLSQSDLQTYTAINSYLISLRRAHLRLTDLWKITSLRRHYPAPPSPARGASRGGRQMVRLLRQRHTTRASILRNAWATASAAIFFLGETESYLQTEVVAGLSDGFHQWLVTGQDQTNSQKSTPAPPSQTQKEQGGEEEEEDDIWLAPNTSNPPLLPPTTTESTAQPHDPQTLATAHRLYLRTLISRLLLNQQTFTDPLYELLAQIDHLVSLVHRLDLVWTAADLEADVGVVDAFVDLAREERDVTLELRSVEDNVKMGIRGVVEELKRLEGKHDDADYDDDEDGAAAGMRREEEKEEERGVRWEKGEYVPRRVGGVDRLLMKLDFGSWF